MCPPDGSSSSTEQNVDSRDGAPDKTTTTFSVNLMEYPPEIAIEVFKEAIRKPAVHYGSYNFCYGSDLSPVQLDVGRGLTLDLREWSNGDIKSGYLSSKAMWNACALSYEAAKRMTTEPSRIKYAHGCEIVDASTDLLCLEHRAIWDPDNEEWKPAQCFDIDRHTRWTPEVNHTHITSLVGGIRRAGVRVSKAAWSSVLEGWFCRKGGHEHGYTGTSGVLQHTHLGALMTRFMNLEAFYLVLTDVSEEDWNAYYASESIKRSLVPHRRVLTKLITCLEFPIAFHDHTGSYAEVYEKPTHHDVMTRIWGRTQTNYPYMDAPKLGIYPGRGFGALVATQIKPQQEVSLLIALLEAAKDQAQYKRKNLMGIRLGILARKLSKRVQGDDANTSGNETMPKYGRWERDQTAPDLITPGNEDVRKALDWIGLESDLRYAMVESPS